jgi:hypothetical protein
LSPIKVRRKPPTKVDRYFPQPIEAIVRFSAQRFESAPPLRSRPKLN